MSSWRRVSLLPVLMLLAAACGDDAEVTTTSAPTTTSTAAETTTTTVPPPEYGAPWLWLSGGPGGTLSKVDGATGEVTTTILVGTEALGNIALGPGGLWASECDTNTVFLVSTETNEVAAAIPVEGCPTEIATFPGMVLVLAQHRQAIVQIDPIGFRVVAGSGGGYYQPYDDIEGASNIAGVLPVGSAVLGYGAAGNLLVTISADGEVVAAAVGPGNVVMVVLQDGRVQWFDRWGLLLGRDHTQMHPYRASWENGQFCVVGWDSAGRSRLLCGDPLAGVPLTAQDVPQGTVAFTSYGGTLYTSTSEGALAAQTMGDPASFRELGETGSLTARLVATPKNPAEGGNTALLCPQGFMQQETEEGAEYQTEGWPQVLQAWRNPAGVPGWGRPGDPTRPAGPDNPPVTSMGLSDPTASPDPQANPLVARSCADARPLDREPVLCPEITAHQGAHGPNPEFNRAVVGMQLGAVLSGRWPPLSDPSRPEGPDNPAMTGIGLADPALPWDPEENPLVFRVCPG